MHIISRISVLFLISICLLNNIEGSDNRIMHYEDVGARLKSFELLSLVGESQSNPDKTEAYKVTCVLQNRVYPAQQVEQTFYYKYKTDNLEKEVSRQKKSLFPVITLFEHLNQDRQKNEKTPLFGKTVIRDTNLSPTTRLVLIGSALVFFWLAILSEKWTIPSLIGFVGTAGYFAYNLSTAEYIAVSDTIYSDDLKDALRRHVTNPALLNYTRQLRAVK